MLAEVAPVVTAPSAALDEARFPRPEQHPVENGQWSGRHVGPQVGEATAVTMLKKEEQGPFFTIPAVFLLGCYL